jgi:CheY-like chemotaxis protein
MPVMDGIVASSIIRDYEEDACLPRSTIMAVTGVGSSEVQEEACAAGIDEYLVKPLALHDLKRIMGIS